jgi:hypothetical protein
MSPEPKTTRAQALDHARARMLSSDAMDIELEPQDAEWLAGHLSGCSDCVEVAAEYKAMQLELRSLPMPEPPRDLWARTSAALEAAESRSHGGAGAVRSGRRPVFGTTAAVVAVVAIATVSLVSQTPLLNPGSAATASGMIAVASGTPDAPSGGPVAPIAFVNGTGYWMSHDGDEYTIKGALTDCRAGTSGCTVAGGSGQTLGSISSQSEVSAVIGPDARQAAVWTDSKIAIVPLSVRSDTVALDLLTPRPTVLPTASPPATPVAVESPTALPSGTVAAPTPEATASAAASPTFSSGDPVAILSGYEIVGRDPAFSPDGALLAFAARPVDHSTGADVFVWRRGQEQAQPVTLRHSDLFSGWFGARLLISEIASADGSGVIGATSYVYDPAQGDTLRIDRPMLLPTVDPTGRYLVYWSGAVRFDPVSGLWQPGNGELCFDAWSDLTLSASSFQPVPQPSATLVPTPAASPSPAQTIEATPSVGVEMSADPSPLVTDQPAITPAPSAETTPPTGRLQILPVASAPGSVFDWSVRWDGSGRYVAVWVANKGSLQIGRLTLFSVDVVSGTINVGEPLLAAEMVLSTIAIDDQNLIYTSAVDGKMYLQPMPAVPPSNASTPSPTQPGQTDGASPLASAPATDRPGN